MAAARDTQENELHNRNIVALNHPSGSKIYLVATAHISKQSINDVIETIENVSPAVIVLEIDEDRMNRLLHSTDTYGIQRFKSRSTLQIIGLTLSGEISTYASGLFYAAAGALMGTKPGGEFLAAMEAAKSTGATVIYADRSQSVTMRRLQWSTRLAQQQQQQQQQQLPAGSSPFPGSNGTSESFPPSPLPRPRSAQYGDSRSRSPRSTTIDDDNNNTGNSTIPSEEELPLDLHSSSPPPADNTSESPWGLEDAYTIASRGDSDSSKSPMKARLLRMMQEEGCHRPNAVLAAAQRLLLAGLDPKGQISVQDVMEVRSCGTTLVENFRKRALEGDDTLMKSLEEETMAGATGALGAGRNRAAMRSVIVDERDLILARRLWEAGNEAGPQQSVVGVVGAGHVKGIQKYWDMAGSPAVEERVQQLMTVPAGEGPPSPIGVAVTGGVLGYIAYKRPRAAALFAGAVMLLMAPNLGVSVVSMKRFAGLAEKLAKASEQAEFGEGMGEWMDGGMNGGD